jgi:hypothetical protein
MKFRKKPVVIEAQQYHGENARPIPLGVCLGDGECMHDNGHPIRRAHVQTLEGPLFVTPDDWIITGVKGERYPCKPDIFAATYEPTE